MWRTLAKFARSLESSEIGVGGPVQGWRDIGWTKPKLGWIKMNTDGVAKGNPGLDSANIER